VDTDIDHTNYQSENDPQFRLDENQAQAEENISAPVQENNSSKTYGPKNPLQWKVHTAGINQIQSPQSFALRSMKDRSVSLQSFGATMDAEAFAKFVRWEAKHQNMMNQLYYVEERTEKDREFQEELSETSNKEGIEKQMKRIDIQRWDAA
jgi:hypothetical protein